MRSRHESWKASLMPMMCATAQVVAFLTIVLTLASSCFSLTKAAEMRRIGHLSLDSGQPGDAFHTAFLAGLVKVAFVRGTTRQLSGDSQP
jgi:hypothetical protein